MKRLMLLLLSLGMWVGVGSSQNTISVKGTISGALCAAEGMLCPSNPNHLQQHYELAGIFTNNKKFYLLANIPQKLLQANFLKSAEVEGTDLGNHLLKVRKLTIGGKAVFESGAFIDPMGHHVEYSKAVWKNGHYLCPACAKMEAGKN